MESCADVPPEVLQRDEEQRAFEAAPRNVCKKCGEVRAVIVLRKAPTCWNCFLTAWNRKFKAIVSKVRPNKWDPLRLLVCVSGGPASRALLRSLDSCFTQSDKKILLEPHVLHLDESELFPRTAGPELASYCTHPLVVRPLSAALPGGLPALRQLLDAAGSATSREAVLRAVKQTLFEDTARELGVATIALGTSATAAAVGALAAVAQGCGAGLPELVQAAGPRGPGLAYVLPLRDFLAKEIAFYCRFHQLESFTFHSFGTMQPKKASIERLSEDFLGTLQAEFDHTTHTLLSCVDKLAVPESPLRCRVCTLPFVQPDADQIASASCCGQDSKTGGCACQRVPSLCRSCLLNVPSASEVAWPPAWTRPAAAGAGREQMREQIKDFLLEED